MNPPSTSDTVDTLVAHWNDRIERDLAAFLDPGTTLELTRDRRSISASWIQRGTSRDAVFAVSIESGVQVQVGGRSMSYSSFLASPDMADLRGIAKMILQMRKQRLYVPTKARRTGNEDTGPEPALDVLRSAVGDPWGDDATLVVMVTGEAGAGKTSVLQELVRTQAEDYVRGKTECLFLYVNAQGRALARFHEALATELQDLRALLTYHGVSALVRLGILVPVIDGFDELLGVGGYDDAFSSLANFIEELDGTGHLIASARSTYYEQEFVARANKVSGLGSQVWKQIPVEVVAWGDAELGQYVDLRLAAEPGTQLDTADVSHVVQQVFKGQNAPLKEKPLFVARTVDLALSGVDLTHTEDLLDVLVASYLERERTEKLLDRSGTSLLSRAQLRGLLVDLAEEMWNQETRELDRRSVREVAEYALVTQGIGDAAQRVVMDRMPDLAFLMPGERAGSIAFEHETFFSFFLAHRFAHHLKSDTGIHANLLGRSVLPPDVAKYTVRILSVDRLVNQPQPLLDRLADAGTTESPRTQQVRENAGLLAAFLLEAASESISGALSLQIRNIIIPGHSLHGVRLWETRFEQVEMRRVDLTTSRIEDCRATDMLLVEPLLDRIGTRLEIEGIDPDSQVIGVQEVTDRGTRTVFDPAEVREILVAIGLLDPEKAGEPSYYRVAKEEFSILERFARAYNRSNPVCTSDDYLLRVFQHPSWDTIQELLESSGVVTAESRAAGGRPKTFLRRQVRSEEILLGANRDASVPTSVRRFWERLETVFPLNDVQS